MKLIIFFFFTSNLAFANNQVFLPGDAYFPSTLSIKDLSSSDNSISINYKRFSSTYMFCGYAGYHKAVVNNVSKETINELKNIIKITASSNINMKIPILIHNKTFNYKKYSPLLKYNENWKEEIKLTPKQQHGHYDPYTNESELHFQDGKYSTTIPKLKLSKPLHKIKTFMGSQTPIHINSSEIMFIVLQYNSELSSIFPKNTSKIIKIVIPK